MLKRYYGSRIKIMSTTVLMHRPCKKYDVCNSFKKHIFWKFWNCIFNKFLCVVLIKLKHQCLSALPTIVTLKEQLATFPELSEALHETAVSPNGNIKLSGWLQLRRGELSTLSHTAGMKGTPEAVESPTSVMKSASEQLTIGAWLSAKIKDLPWLCNLVSSMYCVSNCGSFQKLTPQFWHPWHPYSDTLFSHSLFIQIFTPSFCYKTVCVNGASACWYSLAM